MKGYFKFIGIVLLFFSSINILLDILFIFICIAKSSYDSILFLFAIITLPISVFFSPALGLLFISHSKSLPDSTISAKPEPFKWNNVKYSNKGNHSAIKQNNEADANAKFKINDMVVCKDKNLVDKYCINSIGEIVQIHNDDIYVKFTSDKGNFTLKVATNQIKKQK